MIEIICVIWLLNQNGKIAIARGQNPSKYRAITLGLWFGLEVLGTIAGTLIGITFSPNSKPLMIAYAFGITGALLGALLSRVIVNRAPLGNYKPQEPFFDNGNTTNAPYGNGIPYQATNPAQNIMSKPLSSPATIHVVNEYYWNDNSQDMIFYVQTSTSILIWITHTIGIFFVIIHQYSGNHSISAFKEIESLNVIWCISF